MNAARTSAAVRNPTFRTVPLQLLNEVGSIGGSVDITGASGLVVIGDPGHGNCAANVISGADARSRLPTYLVAGDDERARTPVSLSPGVALPA